MLINELTFYELKRIITPVIQMQPMSRVVSEIGEVFGISEPTRKKIQKQEAEGRGSNAVRRRASGWVTERSHFQGKWVS